MYETIRSASTNLHSSLPTRPPDMPTPDPEFFGWKRGPGTDAKNFSTYTAKCGHTGPVCFYLSLWGREMAPGPMASEMCADCLVEFARLHVIRCAQCGIGITPGIVVHADAGITQKDKSFPITIIDGNAVCCENCGDAVANWGIWAEDHTIDPLPSIARRYG